MQSFFQPTASQNASNDPPSRVNAVASSDPPDVGDGFTSEERVVHHPSAVEKSWNPPQEYDEVEIKDLVPGPGCRTFMGRIANFFDQPTQSKRPRAARGCVKIIVKDDSGAITVSFLYDTKTRETRVAGD